MTEQPNIDSLYKALSVITESKEDKKTHITEFLHILNGTKGDGHAKRLASQFIARLFKEFPEHQDQAYNCMIDLIEDEDVNIRKQVITDFPKLCKDVPSYVAKIADILVQMLQTDDSMELVLVQQSLLHLLNQDLMETLRGIFAQIHHEDVPENTRERAVKFLSNKLKNIEISTKAEEFIVEQINKALEDVSEEEFIYFVRILAALKNMQTLTGRQKLVDMIVDQADFQSAFEPTDISCIARLRECSNQALPFLSKNINAHKFVVYFLDHVIPNLESVPREMDDQKPRLDLLHAFAELSNHAGTNFNATDAQQSAMVKYMKSELPTPPEGAADTEAAVELPKESDLNFSEVECLLYAFLNLANADFIVKEISNSEFKKRLQYFAQANQLYLKSLKKSFKTDEAGDKPDNKDNDKMRATALRLTDNIHSLIKDLFMHPPQRKPELTLSWKPHESRKRPAAYDDAANGTSSSKSRRVPQTAYQPPAGKFSERAGKAPIYQSQQRYGRSRYANPRSGYGSGQQQQHRRRSGGGGGGGGWSNNNNRRW